jgi:dCMP deaminase
MNYAVVSYIPALHKGYIDFFKKYPGTLYILGMKFVRETPRMDRDIRALAPEEVKAAVDALSLFSKTLVLDEKNIDQLIADTSPIVMPDEDVSHQFAEKHLPGKSIDFANIFLRWDRPISTKEFEVAPDRIISEDEFDKKIIGQAFEEAKKSPDWWRQIGAVLVRDGQPIVRGYNEILPSEYSLNTFGDPRSNFDAGQSVEICKTIHAEARVIAEAARQGISVRDTVLYTTTFPCPVCARLIAVAGIKEVYYAKGYSLLDAEDILKEFGVKLVMVK